MLLALPIPLICSKLQP